MKRVISIWMAGAVVMLAWPRRAEAIPGYARNMKTDCRTCHTIYPQLNANGKQFKESLTEDLRQETFGAFSVTEAPLSALFKLRPLDKRFSNDKTTSGLEAADKQLKTRSYHEAEVFLSGRTGKLSFFSEIEAEDEWSDGEGRFLVKMNEAYAGYQFKPEVNLLLGYASPLVYDGNDTVHHHNVLRRDWSASGFVPGKSQFIAVAGRPHEMFSYIAAFHGDDGDEEGHDPASFSLRGTFDYVGESFNVTAGAYTTFGSHYNAATSESDIDYTLYGIDARVNIKNFNVMALVGFRDDDANAGSDTDFNISIEANARFGDWFPLVNLDTYTEDGDSDNGWTKSSFGLGYSFMPNAKVILSLESTLDAPDAYKEKEQRLTLNADFGF